MQSSNSTQKKYSHVDAMHAVRSQYCFDTTAWAAKSCLRSRNTDVARYEWFGHGGDYSSLQGKQSMPAAE
jgi:hypothetical protein